MTKKKSFFTKDYLLKLIFAFTICSWGLPIFGQTQKNITLQLEKVNLIEFFKAVEKNSDLRFSYINQEIDMRKDITLNTKNENVEELVKRVLNSMGYTYVRTGNTIAITKSIKKNTPKTKQIKGKVTDSSGIPIPGVTVFIKGTSIGSVTNSVGTYLINNVPEDASLQFKFIGMTTKVVSIGNKTTIDVSLDEDAVSLQEVVAVGYGTMKKSDITGSVSKITNDKSEQQATASLENLLQGKSSGVDILQTSGAPGAGILFNIRGTNSIGSNQPLIVLDGYPIESGNSASQSKAGIDYWGGALPETNILASLNPNDIASVEILKDASSTAIYGSRGANGVVLITTKRGSQSKDRVSYNYRTDFSNIPKQIPMLSGPEYITFANEARINGKQDPAYNVAQIKRYEGVSNNWQDQIYRTSISQDHQISFIGGDKKTKYAIIANYSIVNGIVNPSKFEKGGIRVNLDREFNNKLSMGVNFNTNLSTNNSVIQSTNHSAFAGSVISSALRVSPLDVPYTADGLLDISLQNNPVAVLKNTSNISKNTVTLANLFATYSINKYLKFKVNGGINQVTNFSWWYNGRGTYTGDTRLGQAYQGYSNNFNYLTEYTLSYYRKIRKHSISAIGGYTWQSWNSIGAGMTVYEFPNDNLQANALQYANQLVAPSSFMRTWALQSFIARLNYTYADKYLLTFTSRMDGASRLAEGHKWDLFPSAALGWNVHKESFLEKSSWLSQLKLRTSYGVSGNQSVGVGATQAQLVLYRAALDVDKVVTGVVMNNFSNPFLGWEHSSQLNAGFDMALLNSKIQLTLDWYKKNTTDLLFNLPIPNDTGFGSYMTNTGEIENSGLNIDLKVQLLEKEFKWSLAGNIGYNRNKVISLGPNQFVNGAVTLSGSLNTSITIAKPGLPIGAFFGYKTDGIYQNLDEVAAGPVDPMKPGPGDIRYVDISGPNGNPDGKIDSNDRIILGSPDPKFSFGLTNQFSYKNFDFSIFIQGNIGQSIANLNRFFSDALVYSSAGNQRVEAWEGRWRGEGTSNYYPKPSSTRIVGDGRFSDRVVEDGSFIRLKSINLSYTFTKKIIPIVEDFKLFVSGTNLLTFTKYKGYDPEVSAFGGNAINRNMDYGTIPQMQTWSCGFNVTF